MRSAPSRRMAVPLSMSLSMMAATMRGIFLGPPEAGRERDAGFQVLAEILGHALQHRRLEQARHDGHHPDAVARQVPRDGKGEPDARPPSTRHRRPGRSARPPPRPRPCRPRPPAPVRRHGVEPGHGGRAFRDHAVGADEVDRDHLVEQAEIVRHEFARIALAGDGAHARGDARAIDQHALDAVGGARLGEGGIDRCVVGDVGLAVERADFGRDRLAPSAGSCRGSRPGRPRPASMRAVASPRPDAPPVTMAAMDRSSCMASSLVSGEV